MANFNSHSLHRRSGLDEEAAAMPARFVQDLADGAANGQGNQISQGEYLRDVLNGTSPVDIIDHGLGPFEDKTMHFQPSGFGVVCILNVSHHSSVFADFFGTLRLLHIS
jgi:hypothetical protein